MKETVVSGGYWRNCVVLFRLCVLEKEDGPSHMQAEFLTAVLCKGKWTLVAAADCMPHNGSVSLSHSILHPEKVRLCLLC